MSLNSRVCAGIKGKQEKNAAIPHGIYADAKVRLAAAGRLRSAVALELAAGKVWALPIDVQPARGIRRRNGTGHSEWVRCHGQRAGASVPPRLRKGGAASVLGRLGNPSSRRLAPCPPCARRRGGAAGWTQSPWDNPADSLMAQGQRCLPYP